MANKTDPIGVRFRKDVLESLKAKNWADSPQKALVFLERFYCQHYKLAEDITQVIRYAPPQEAYDRVKFPDNFNGDEPLSFARLAEKEAKNNDLPYEYACRLKVARNWDEIKGIVREIDADKELTWPQKKTLREQAEELSKTMYND